MRFLVVFAAVAACIQTGTNALAQEAGVSGEPPIAEVRRVLDDSLLNYPETRFRNVRFVRTGFTGGPSSVTGFCGELNTQNRMGGFTGWSPFFVSATPLREGMPDRLHILGRRGTLDDYMDGFTDRLVTTFCVTSPTNLSEEDFSAALSYEVGNE